MKPRTLDTIGVMLVWLAIGGCVAKTQAERVDVPVIRNVQGGGPVADMKSRLADWSIIQGEDTVGMGHYCGHGLHSQIRNQHGGTNRVNAIYLGDGVAYVWPEPAGIRLSSVVRGPMPAYANARQHWENQPLYLVDELGAYFWGTSAGLWANDRSSRTRSSYTLARQLLAQCRRLVVMCRQRGYSHTDELNGVVESAAKSMDRMGRMLGER